MSDIESSNRRRPGTGVRLPHLLLVWLAYISLVVYGSLVPLTFHPLPLETAWAAFAKLPMYQLGVEQRADWVANGVLFVPIGFLTGTLFAANGSLIRRLPFLFLSALFCVVLALALEFTQLFFPPRTVSRNDVMAELIGSGVGIVFALYWSEWFRRMVAALAGRMGQLNSRLLQAYAIGYITFSLFPFDLVVSMTELAAKVNSDTWGWFLAGQSANRGPVILLAKLLAEVLAAVPIGLLVGSRNERMGQACTRHALTFGVLLGLLIEVAQLFIFSGVTQGISILTRTLGMYGGAHLWKERGRLSGLPLHAATSRWSVPLTVLYLLALVAVNGWFDRSWHGVLLAGRSLAETRFLPFYYHYYTTEQAALISLAAVALMYAPVGCIAWLRHRSPTLAFWVAAVTATTIESSKLFLQGLHADPTNVLIGSIAAWSVTRLLQFLQTDSLRENKAAPSSTGQDQLLPTASPSRRHLKPPVTWFSLAAIALLTVWILIDFPFHPVPVAVLLLLYAAIIWFRPHLIWAAIPAAMPLLDLAPWSGRFYLDEMDFLLAVSVAVVLVRTRPTPRGSSWDPLALTGYCLLTATFVISTLGGMLPLALPDANTFTNYYSPFNGLRIAKGCLWALLLVALTKRFSTCGRDIRTSFAAGMVVGLGGTVAVVVWERLMFAGLFDFTDTYRVTGGFSHMRTGAADIETYITAALPFAVILTVQARSLAARAAGGLLVMGSSYALAVTYSRAGYAGGVVAMIISCGAAWLARARHAGSNFGKGPAATPARITQPANRGPNASSTVYRWAAPMILLSVAIVAALPIYSGSFARERLSRISEDLATRQAHWVDALAMRDSGLMTRLFGMGIGRFPETHYWRSAETRATPYRLETENGNTFLRLGSGSPMYIEQFVEVTSDREYVVSLSVRRPEADAAVTVFLCEKLLLTSVRCVFSELKGAHPSGQWEEQQFRLATKGFGSGGAPLSSPVKLSLSNGSKARIDIDNVQLLTIEGENIAHNGDFEQRFDRWSFTVDEHLPWHIKSMPVAILFDQGWFGLLAFGTVLGLGVARTTRLALQGDSMAGATLASLAGMLVIATMNTVIDTPRLLLLLLLLASLGWAGKSGNESA
ncbi:MAG: hypothetical protein FAZ92_00092 [Accumulibacter sp.]|uniref:VanZ family protein n=1 Tax=Accumulibacter sp. TaxID=2053492 RepID=UPI001223BEE9|nr:VanZ family protein [Accumulibacter sp.]TLD47610.1 MAG: hypothetical protein FAZ92_00092 [Accumulibacter sp.]